MPNTAAHLGATLHPQPVARRGRLFRAVVSLPEPMCPADETHHERIVFFTAPGETTGNQAEYLQGLLSHVWQTPAHTLENCIYSVHSEHSLFAMGVSPEWDERLFESTQVQPNTSPYVDLSRVDFLVAPALKLRLQNALDSVVAKGSAA